MTPKSFDIPKTLIWEAYKHVKVNGGAAGIDQQTIEQFEEHLGDNLYKLWNRMCSGSYFPPPVKAVPIPKISGGVRVLGIPTIADRVAQTVVKQWLEPKLDPLFHENSYGYRPGRSAHDAIAVTRRRCWDYDWIVELDVKGLFDNIDHDLLIKALRKHCQSSWALLYVERWLKAPMQTTDGEVKAREKGTPQGGVVSPFWQICSCTMLLTRGLIALYPACGFAVTPMTRFSTARARGRRNSCCSELTNASDSAASNCIRPRHGSCIARTSIVRRITLSLSSRSWAIRSDRARRWTNMAGST